MSTGGCNLNSEPSIPDGETTLLRGLGIWAPNYPSVEALCTPLFSDSPGAAPEACSRAATGDAATMWPEMMEAIINGVRGWDVDCGGCPLIFATAKGDIRRTLHTIDRNDDPLPTLADDAAAIANACGLDGEVIGISTACTSSLAALCEADLLLMTKPSIRRVVVVTADVASAFVCDGFQSLRAVAPAGVRPFDQSRGGLLPGSAAAWCYVERDGGKRDDLRLLGWGFANDAAHLTAPDSQGRGLRAAIFSAMESARQLPRDIDVIIAHGTGTAFSDAMEAGVFAEIFPHRPPLTAVKGLLGHTLGASGMVELAIAHEMLGRQCVPPIAGLDRSCYPGIDPVHGRPRVPVRPIRTVLKTASGFGGVNAAVMVGRRDR